MLGKNRGNVTVMALETGETEEYPNSSPYVALVNHILEDLRSRGEFARDDMIVRELKHSYSAEVNGRTYSAISEY